MIFSDPLLTQYSYMKNSSIIKVVLPFEMGVLPFEKGVLLFEKIVLLFEKGVLLFLKGSFAI